MKLNPLPIDAILPQLVQTLGHAACTVLRAPPGAGKTTRVPPALLDSGLAGAGQIVLLEPRRVAARSAAARISFERGTPLGAETGYRVRFESRAGAATRIIAMTQGVFLRMLHDDPFLERVGVVIFDEFHERQLDADVGLAMVRRVQREFRPELKLVVMSATLDTAGLAQYLGHCPVIESSGRLHPVAISYLPRHVSGPVAPLVIEALERLLAETPGDVLVFLPGVGEIRRAAEALRPIAAQHDLAVMQLYGDLPLDQQQRVLEPLAQRKVVLATNVAETSITIDGVTGVVDSGLVRTLRFEPGVGLNRLELGRISQASAEQRAGRAGRTAPGTCLRLWTAAEQRLLAAEEVPEILRVDLAAAALQLACWGETELADFGWLQSPPLASIEQAIALLGQLGAVVDRRPTELGRLMARLPVHPRLARLLVEGARLGQPRRAALAAALLSERDPFRRAPGGRRTSQHRSASDVLDRVTALEDFERRAGPDSDLAPLDPGAARATLRVRDQLLRLLEGEEPSRDAQACDPDEAVLRALLVAYPDRVARRREPAGRRALLVGGRGVRLADESAVGEADLFVCVDIEEVGQGEALVRQASAIERDWLPADRITSGVDVQFDSQRERVIGWRRTRYADLVISEAPTSIPPDVDPGPILAAAILDRFGDEWPLSEDESAFLARVELLRGAMPELELPDIASSPIAAWLPELCAGQVSVADVRKQSLLGVWKSHFTALQLQAIDRHAPERLQVPSGSFVTLHYELGKPPILAVRIQEVFGWRQTPRIAGQRVRVLLHLLAPNMRPQQITDDLESFWTNTYSQVRKDLRRRYPKHAWPEDPWTAQPEHRPRRNRRS